MQKRFWKDILCGLKKWGFLIHSVTNSLSEIFCEWKILKEEKNSDNVGEIVIHYLPHSLYPRQMLTRTSSEKEKKSIRENASWNYYCFHYIGWSVP